ncbi:hypothetical protein GLAREA_06023 [Glarea lozoyensis ATCC 20868]|uniref:Uncharacterized protein n=1 Tax=Glarea lozoyensis (strain ATCC 20868 / MF5171) TaxID=1116229 RepID=S3DLS5_GLAL2|nr:uncharacterized protein GLAREA_06023 [Glarea lozoyensis ATCC 20868]EPE33011.1 hypothetical protein GLAREA_06023 [Glarea lozoyensis ATCC 20868]
MPKTTDEKMDRKARMRSELPPDVKWDVAEHVLFVKRKQRKWDVDDQSDNPYPYELPKWLFEEESVPSDDPHQATARPFEEDTVPPDDAHHRKRLCFEGENAPSGDHPNLMSPPFKEATVSPGETVLPDDPDNFTPRPFEFETIPSDDPHPSFDQELFQSWHFQPQWKAYNTRDFARALHWYNEIPLELRLSPKQILRLYSPIWEDEDPQTFLNSWFLLLNDAFFFGALDPELVKVIMEYDEHAPQMGLTKMDATIPFRGIIRVWADYDNKRGPTTWIPLLILALMHEMLHVFFESFGCISKQCPSQCYQILGEVPIIKPIGHTPEWADCMRLLYDALRDLVSWPASLEYYFHDLLWSGVCWEMAIRKVRPTPAQFRRWNFRRYFELQVKTKMHPDDIRHLEVWLALMDE